MAVEIKLIGPEDTDEYKDALLLKNIFEGQLGIKTSGDILIINSATLFGQQIKDIDLIVIGNLNNFKLNIKAKPLGASEYSEKEVYINNFCFVIESKRHQSSDISMEGLNLIVKYKGKKHDVTTQSEKQKYSLKNFLEERLGFKTYICNFIWLLNVEPNTIKKLTGQVSTENHNILPNKFSLNWLFQLACTQRNLVTIQNKSYLRFNSFKIDEFTGNETNILQLFNIFEEVRSNCGDLTRKKMEAISERLLRNQLYAQEVGKKLLEISGRAGTGKTMKLLRLATDLAKYHDKRCLILTYNHALVSDIKRLFYFMKMPDGIDTYTVKISTLHKFFYELLIGFDIIKDYNYDYITNYEDYISQLHEFVKQGLIDKNDIQDLMESRHDEVAWDMVLIDESQDWSEFEKNILFNIFGSEKLIIANGMDQLVRRTTNCNWTKGIQYNKIPGNKSLRQEQSLVIFANKFAEKFGVNWKVDNSQELMGGKIFILASDITTEFYKGISDKLKEKENIAYDLLFLIPPSLVSKRTINGKVIREFSLYKDYLVKGIKLWDGSNTEIRTEYSISTDEHRVVQYDSSRGLEGWAVFCLNFDEFVQYKKKSYKEDMDNELVLASLQEKADKYAYTWALIPLTRSIDTLVITLKDTTSDFSKKLYELYQENQDFVEWIE